MPFYSDPLNAKQFKNGTVKLSSTNEGLQLSDRWLGNVFDKTYDSKISDSLKEAVYEGRVETYVAAVDKSEGIMSLIKVNANP